MPLYDIRCSHCEGIFERLIPLQGLHGQTCCPYCKEETAASPMPTGGHVGLQVKPRWQPRNGAEQLSNSSLELGVGCLHGLDGFGQESLANLD